MTGIGCIGPHHHHATPIPPHGHHICTHCQQRIRRDLQTICTLWPLLAVMIQPGNTASSSRGKPGSRPPCNLDVADLTDPRGTVHQQLVGWAGIVAEHRHLSGTPTDTHTAARLLVIHLDWAAGQPWIDDMAAEIHDAAYAIRRACHDLPEPPLGTCPDVDPDGQADRCGGPLRWSDHTAGVRCSRCGSTWRSDDMVHIGRVSPIQIWATIPAIATMLDIPERTLRHWAATGKIRRNSLGQVNHADVWQHANGDTAST